MQICNLNADNHKYSTRSKDEPRIPLHEREYFKYSPRYFAVKIYHNIPDTILNQPDYNFTSKLHFRKAISQVKRVI